MLCCTINPYWECFQWQSPRYLLHIQDRSTRLHRWVCLQSSFIQLNAQGASARRALAARSTLTAECFFGIIGQVGKFGQLQHNCVEALVPTMLQDMLLHHRSVHKEPIWRQHAAQRLDTLEVLSFGCYGNKLYNGMVLASFHSRRSPAEAPARMWQSPIRAIVLRYASVRWGIQVRMGSSATIAWAASTGSCKHAKRKWLDTCNWSCFSQNVRFPFRSWGNAATAAAVVLIKWMSLEFMEQKTVSPSQSPPEPRGPESACSIYTSLCQTVLNSALRNFQTATTTIATTITTTTPVTTTTTTTTNKFLFWGSSMWKVLQILYQPHLYSL